MERCTAFKPHYDKSQNRATLRADDGKCLHYYFYFIDENLGLCYLRVPTWAPFRLQFYFNGHNWLSRQLDDNGFAFNLVDNAFVDISDFEQAQHIADSFNVRRLHRILERYASMCCPVVKQFRAGVEWTIMQIEYATDIVFRRREDLQRLYEPLIRTAVHAVKADDVAKFLGRKQVHGNFKDELGTDFGTRVEGTRLKHHMAKVSIKMYDKHGLVLRLETTTNDVKFFSHYRTVVHRDGVGRSTKVAPVLKSIYSLGVMSGLLSAANRRYSAFLSALDQPNIDLRGLDRLSRSIRHRQRSYRGFNLFHGVDLVLFLAIARGEFTISGFRNQDLQRHMGLKGSQVSRFLKRLRLHGLIKKVGRRYKYYLTDLGRRTIACVLRLRQEVMLPALAQPV
jgi:DNA-binding MarR family transcriptional regulator